ncbi:MAG: alpha-L-rhamnosidase, partial [Limisphaerales bacterium]
MRNTLRFLFCFLFVHLAIPASAQIEFLGLQTEYLNNPIGIDSKSPRLTWALSASDQGVYQCGFELELYQGNSSVERTLVETITKKTAAMEWIVTQSLQSASRYFWRLKVTSCKGEVSDWSSVQYFETGLLNPEDWEATWIRSGFDEDYLSSNPLPVFEKTFKISKEVNSSRLYITSLGLYKVLINGQVITDSYFNPGWTSYNKRLQYGVYDVGQYLKEGENIIAITLGDGWYRGVFGQGDKQRNFYGKELELLAQLFIQFEDKSNTLIKTNKSWTVSTGAIVKSDIYNGEQVDLNKKGFKTKVKEGRGIESALIAKSSQAVKVKHELAPFAIFSAPNGDTIIDFGQNLTGRIKLNFPKKPFKVRIEHAEVLDKKGNFYTANLRSAKQLIEFTSDGSVSEYSPEFSFMGFRYARIHNWPFPLEPTHFKAEVLYSDLDQTGSFSCNDSLINKLYENVLWGQRGNFLEVPTDCPQRDERMGWAGDAQVFFNTAAYNMDVSAFFKKWLKDLTADQFSDGRVPHVIPHIMARPYGGAAGWADAAVLIPWRHYWMYGDIRILEDQYPSMKAWVNYVDSVAGEDGLWNTGNHFGDWNFYSLEEDWYGKSAITDKHLIAQAYFAHSAHLLCDIAELLDKSNDRTHYKQVAARAKKAFNYEYVSPGGRVGSGTQTAYVLALDFDLLADSLRAQAAQRLVANIRTYKNHLTTGFLGTPQICPVLTRFGYSDVAYELLHQETYPSWLYTVKNGATTMWERWGGIDKNGDFEDIRMNSFNHYAYGAIGEWMYSSIGGIKAIEPGFKTVLIEPVPGGEIDRAKVKYQSRFGEIISDWEIVDENFELKVKIPVNTDGIIKLPIDPEDIILVNGKEFDSKEEYHSEQEVNKAVLKLPPGEWFISCKASRFNLVRSENGLD